MAITPNSMLEWTLLTVKPENTDRVNPTYDIDADEQKCQLYSDFKALFVLRDEDHDINANHEYQTNKKLKFGSAGEFELLDNATDMFFKSVKPTGKTIFKYNSGTLGSPVMQDFLTLDPVNGSISTHGNAINNLGTAGLGINFDGSDRPVLLSVLQCNAGIATKLKNVSYTGAVNTGLEFAITNVGYFKQKLICEEDLDVTGQINANKTGDYSIDANGNCIFRDNVRFLSYLSGNGDDAGIRINADNSITISGFTQILKSPTSLVANGDILTYGDYTLGGSANYIAAGGSPGGTATFNPSTATSVQFKNGLYITHS